MRSFLRLCFVAALCVGAAFATPRLARADAFAGLASGQFDTVAQAVTDLAVSGSAQADTVLRALEHRQLFFAPDGGLFMRENTAYVDARTGQPVAAPPEGLTPVRLNNRVRKALAGARAGMDLFSTDRAARLGAATTLYERHDPAALPLLEHALSAEKDTAIRKELALAHAATILAQPPVADQLAARMQAVAALRATGGLEARGLLASVGAAEAEDPQLRKAAQEAVSSIDWRLRAWSIGQNAFYGLSFGSVLLLAATGLAITFGVMGVINMAHGELVMIGAYVTWLVQQGVRAVAPSLEPVALLLAIPVAFCVCGGLGVLIERGLIRFLYGRPLETLLATWGLSLIMQQAVRSVFGPTNIAVTTPGWLTGSFALGGMEITLNRLAILIFAFLVLGALMCVLRRTPLGLQMRAVTQNRRMAALMGIRTPRVDALAFGLGAGLAGLAGVAVSQIDNVSPNLGQTYIIDSFMVVVFGGVGNLWGTLAAAMTLGMGGKVLEPVIGAVSAKIAILVLVILYIQRNPRGMFPVRGRGVES